MNTLLSARKIDMQLKEEMRMNSRNRSRGRTTIQRYSNYSKLGHNAYTCKKDEETSNIYSFD